MLRDKTGTPTPYDIGYQAGYLCTSGEEYEDNPYDNKESELEHKSWEAGFKQGGLAYYRTASHID